ncbi:MAG: PBSX family phage terminase large subunit [Cetobacterium sp.]
MKQIQIDLPEKIAQIFEPSNIRYRVAYGGRGSGKSIGYSRMLLVKALEKKTKVLCCRELQKSMKDSVHSLLVSQIDKLGLQSEFDIGREYLRGKNGSEFLFYGLRSNAAEIKSMDGINICWVEEGQAASTESLTYLFPTIRENNSEIWITFNPADELDPVYNMFVTGNRGNSIVKKINFYDNPFFPQVLELERQEDLKNNNYNWVWLGELNLNNEASVYGKWINNCEQKGRFKTNLYDPSLPVHTAWDIGYSDDTAIWWYQIAGNEVRLIDYYSASRQDVKSFAEQIYGREIKNIKYGENAKILSYELGSVTLERRTKYKYSEFNLPHDAANKLLQAGGRSMVDQLHELGIKAKVVHSTSQQNQIQGARATLEHTWIDSEFCKDGVRCLRKYEFEKKSDSGGYSHNPKHDIYSHGCDAFEVISQVWKSAKPDPIIQRPRFLNEMTVDELFYSGIVDTNSIRI